MNTIDACCDSCKESNKSTIGLKCCNVNACSHWLYNFYNPQTKKCLICELKERGTTITHINE